jgi:hypothetical protein
MSRIEDLNIGDLATQNGEYSKVSESNGILFYALIDEREYEENQLDAAYRVCDMDEDKFAEEE